ncbi:MAG: hypothetical protein H7A51_19600 [Akkermansiaceae bacterium]|nr:hypothetical protein [Akkermansiaceae bacterium]
MKPGHLLAALGLFAITATIAAPVVLRPDDTQSGISASTPGLADNPVHDNPPIGNNDGAWGYSTGNGQALLGSGTEADRLANHVWGSRVDLGEDAPALTTTVSGLDPAATYQVYLYQVTSGTWGIKASLGAAPLVSYQSGSGTVVDSAGGSSLERILLGETTGSATLTINLDDLTGVASARSFIKGIGLDDATPAATVAGNYIHGEGHSIAATWKASDVTADFEANGLLYSDGTQALQTEPGRAALNFGAGSINSPLYATLDTRPAGAFAGLTSNGAIDASGDSIYFSVLINIPAGVTEASLACFALSNSPGSSSWESSEILRVGKLPGQANLGFTAPAAATTHISSTAPDGNTHLLVGRIDFTSGNDTLTVWLDPQVSLEETDPTQTSPLGTASGDFSFQGYQLRGNTPYQADEVRVGETWRSVLPLADSDNDTLPDDWELEYWGDLTAAPGDDSDGDGVSNFKEYQAGTNPLRPDSLPSSALVEEESTDLFLEWYSSPQRYYQVQRSWDLIDWEDLGDAVLGDGREYWTSIPATTAPRHFYRLIISPTPIISTP